MTEAEVQILAALLQDLALKHDILVNRMELSIGLSDPRRVDLRAMSPRVDENGGAWCPYLELQYMLQGEPDVRYQILDMGIRLGQVKPSGPREDMH